MDPTRPVAVTLTHTAETVGEASGELVASNTSRRALIIQNTHASATIHVRFDGGVASATTGVKIAAGNLVNMRELGVITHSAITAISDTASTTVTVVEG